MEAATYQQWFAEVGQHEEIVTRHINPPIPNRNFDWCATRASYEGGDAIGYGPTEQAAIQALKEQEDV